MDKVVLSIRLECDKATAEVFDLDVKSSSVRQLDIKLPRGAKLPPCDTREAVKKKAGAELVLTLGKYISQLQQRCNLTDFVIALSTPGTIDSSKGVIVRSTRLGIHEPFPITKALAESYSYTAYLFNDTKSMAIGEMRHGIGADLGVKDLRRLSDAEDFAFILVSEGVGSAIFIAGRQYTGAGAGGHLGRMIVSPTGPYSETFRCRGPLEVFTSREWISRHVINEYQNIVEKDHLSIPAATARSRIQQIALSASDPLSVSADDLARAVEEQDEVVIDAIDEASQYLGLALSDLITIMNIPVIILGGEMMDKIPRYFDNTFKAAKKYSWPVAWERTRLLKAKLGAGAQLWGGAELALDVIKTGKFDSV